MPPGALFVKCVDFGVGDREGIAAGDNAEDACRILAGIRRRIDAP